MQIYIFFLTIIVCMLEQFYIPLQVMFVVLRMSDNHYSDVMKGEMEGSFKDHKASISYTKIYNLLNADDRTELMDLIFWFDICTETQLS